MQEVYKFDIDGMTVNFPDKLQHLIENENNCKACTHNYYSLQDLYNPNILGDYQ